MKKNIIKTIIIVGACATSATISNNIAQEIAASSFEAGKIAKYNEITQRAEDINQYGEGYFTSQDVEEILEGYYDDEESL